MKDLFNEYPEPENTIPEILARRKDWEGELAELCPKAFETVTRALMSGLPVETHIVPYVENILNTAGKAGTRADARDAADRAASDRGDPHTRTVLEAAYKADHEIERMKGLLRFNPRENGFYLARCAPDGFMLPALGDHFFRRFGDAPWVIIDEKRNLMLIRRPGEAPRMENAGSGNFTPGSPSDPWEELWCIYHRSVTIENRGNPALQRQFIPVRYWKYLPEMSPGNKEKAD